jgi:predicted porin
MKKLLIATAALAMVAGTAQAQSSVTVYGILDMGYSDVSTKAADADNEGVTTNTKGINNGAGLSGSRLGFRGTEDLGGGLRAGFVYETALQNDSSSAAIGGVRQALLSLSSKDLGSLNFGRGNTLGKNTNDGFTAFGGGGSFEQGSVALELTRGNALKNGTADKSKPIADRASNQATYISPSFSGVTLQAQVVSKSVDKDGEDFAGETASSGTAFQLAYAGNGFTLAYTRSDLDSDTEATEDDAAVKAKTKLDQFGATYTMGNFKVFGLYNTVKYKANAETAEAENKGYDIGATYTMGKTTLLVAMGDGEMKNADGDETTDVKGLQAQVRYALSKRTTAYALYGKTEYKNAVAGESDVTMIGVRHSF